MSDLKLETLVDFEPASACLELEPCGSQLILAYRTYHPQNFESMIHCRFHVQAGQAWIGAIDVAEQYRHQGFGRKLVAVVEELAFHLEIRRLRVLPVPSSVGFWSRLGFLPDCHAARILNKWIGTGLFTATWNRDSKNDSAMSSFLAREQRPVHIFPACRPKKTNLMPSAVEVFAYGSNLSLKRIRQRAPSAHPIGIGYVEERRIEFRKRSLDGSAKADARYTGDSTDRVWGAIYQISARDKLLLDEHESLGVGYDQLRIDVHISSDRTRTIGAFIYVARQEMVDDSIHPYSWYLDFVREGALQHALPFCYVSRRLAVKSVVDPNLDRQTANHRILNEVCSSSSKNSEHLGTK